MPARGRFLQTQVLRPGVTKFPRSRNERKTFGSAWLQPIAALRDARRSAVTNSFADGDLLITEEPRLPVFEGGLNLPSLVWPSSRPRGPALFAPA
jgi:hypothetical protein